MLNKKRIFTLFVLAIIGGLAFELYQANEEIKQVKSDLIQTQKAENHYHILHNRQTWMLMHLDSEQNHKLAATLDADNATDKELATRYAYMDYKK